jgi:hypothetical protein
MNVIYHCHGGAHSSVMAAAIHTGRVTAPSTLSIGEVMALPYFDIQDDDELGAVRSVGVDYAGNRVYVMGRDRFSVLVERLFSSLSRLVGIDRSSYILSDALRYVNPLMVVGGTLSRRFRMVSLGRRIAAEGTRRAAPYLAGAVAFVEKRIQDLAKASVCVGPERFNKVVVFHCYGRGQTALLAAACYAGLLHPQCPDRHDRFLPDTVFKHFGRLVPGAAQSIGSDREGNLVVAVGLGCANRLLARSARDFLEVSGISPDRIVLQDTSEANSIWFDVAHTLATAEPTAPVGRALRASIWSAKRDDIWRLASRARSAST